MVASGDYIVPRVQDRTRLIKPIGVYWLQAAVLEVATKSPSAIGLHRVPSVLGALVAVLGTYWIGVRWLATGPAWLGAALLAASALLVVEAHLATTDAVLLACVVAAQGCLAALYSAARRGRPGSARNAAAFWLAQAAGMLVKGPAAPLVSGLTIAVLLVADRGVARRLLLALRPWWGVPLAAACMAPWVIAVGSRAGWPALPAAMASDLLPKLAGGHESHGGPPGLYLLMVPATFWPGSLALVFALVMGWRRRRRPAERFLLAWLVPTWLVFECLPTKLPNYVLPAFPALALLAARAALTAPAKLRPPLRHAVIRILLIGWCLLTLAAGFAPAAAVYAWGPTRPTLAAALVALAAVAIASVCLRRCWRGDLPSAAWTAALAAVLVYAPVLHWVLPGLDTLWPSRAAAGAIARIASDRPLAAVGYAEPSLVFLTRSDIALLSAEAAAAFLTEHVKGLVLVSGDQLAAFTAAAQRRGIGLRNLWSEPAFNYSTGAWIDLQLFTASDGAVRR